ncbi:carboxypeptidase regulatory-like domain-containing protein [Horticoccus sp. 23ND18S-11]|uniref:carboxypeptidase regulatory-like domain-containing protein n=1 Tax=Horticoccus sp. 23ND18S-11 TaxID=3391832 RepID=UPI0039C9D7DD
MLGLTLLPVARGAGNTAPPPSGAVAHGTATITGRVQNSATGQYLNNARITVKGTDLVAFTDESGTYRLTAVPDGNVTLEVFYTGMEPQQIALPVAGAATIERDINLAGGSRFRNDKEVVKLDSLVVSSSREMDGAAIAINEQRFAANIVNVVSADEFGVVPDGNVGEFLKMLPGITMSYRGGDPREISMNGVPSDNVPVTIGGFSLATSEVSGTGRNVELNAVSINNLSRIEAVYSPTPESPGSALAGSVNLVPRSAFERSRPIFNGSVYLAMRDSTKQFHRSPGPAKDPTYKVRPGFEFSWIVPVNKRFGFTVSAGASTQYVEGPLLTNTWRGAGAATNGTTLPDTTPDRPYLSDFLVRVESKIADRSSFATTADYKLGPASRLSFSFQYGTFHTDFNQRSISFIVNRVLPGEFSPSFTHGFAGAGEIRISNSGNHRYSRTYMPSLTYRYDGPVWRAEAGLGSSHAENRFRSLDKGRFGSTLARRTGVTVSFDDNFYLRPRTITVTEGATGTPVDPYNINSYALSTAGASPQLSRNVQRTAFANLRRDLDWRWPLTLKAGVDVRQSRSDNRTSTSSVTYLGADGRATTTPLGGSDDGAGAVFDPYFFQRAGLYGIPRVQWVSNEAVLDLYRAKPALFTLDENAKYRSEVNSSKRSEEIISAAFLRGDVQFLDRRLKLIGGLRAEQTNIEARGPRNDPTLNYQRDASGRVILGANGRPATITSDPLGIARLTIIDRGAQAEKEYLRLFPSINASYNVRDNLIARAAYYHSVGRPNFNQYSGGITLPDIESPPSTTNRIVVNNAGIKAWSARTGKVTLEYYFERVGLLSIGAFRRDFENFFGSTAFDATPAFLSLYGLDPALYDPYQVATQENLATTVRMQGMDINYKQALTFLPRWARGVQVFANGSAQRATGDGASNFAGYIPRTGSWGVSLSREKYNLRLNWNYLGRQRRGIVTGRSIEANTYNWGLKRSYIDVTGEYSLSKRFAVFANLRNVNDPTDDVEISGPNTPAVAQFRQRAEFGSLWTFGIKGTF